MSPRPLWEPTPIVTPFPYVYLETRPIGASMCFCVVFLCVPILVNIDSSRVTVFGFVFGFFSARDCLERLVPEMTYYVSRGTLNSTHSLTLSARLSIFF